MKTLSDQLTELYESKWDGLMAQLEANGLKEVGWLNGTIGSQRIERPTAMSVLNFSVALGTKERRKRKRTSANRL